MKTKCILFALIGILVVSCKNENRRVGVPTQPEIAIESPDFEEIRKNNYSIKVHKDWIVERNPEDEMDLYIYMDGEDDFVESINLIINDLTNKKATIQDIEKETREQYIIMGGSIISSEQIVLPNKNYQRMIVKFPFYGEDLKSLQHFLINNEKVYILTFTSLERDFNKYEKVAEQIMQSFKIRE